MFELWSVIKWYSAGLNGERVFYSFERGFPVVDPFGKPIVKVNGTHDDLSS
jgi:hypothetical protein